MKIYVGNLTPETQESKLREVFAPHSTVNRARLAIDKATGQPRGFGFVEVLDERQARKAIAALSGSTLNGRKLTVKEARRKEDRGSSGRKDLV